jgi:hypothetical protein
LIALDRDRAPKIQRVLPLLRDAVVRRTPRLGRRRPEDLPGPQAAFFFPTAASTLQLPEPREATSRKTKQ